MNDLEKKLEEAAERHSKTAYFYPLHETTRKLSFIEGAKSSEAYELHTYNLKIEMIAKCAKMQVKLKENLYTEEEVTKITTDFFYFWYNAPGENTMEAFEQWFNLNKK